MPTTLYDGTVDKEEATKFNNCLTPKKIHIDRFSKFLHSHWHN